MNDYDDICPCSGEPLDTCECSECLELIEIADDWDYYQSEY